MGSFRFYAKVGWNLAEDSRFYEAGLKFECRRCSDCCRISPGYVYLSKKDLTSLRDWFKIGEDEFIGKYCRWVQYYGTREALCLREKGNYDCVLWENGCTAYGARPVQCSTYPFWPWILKSRETWDAEAKDCKGMNSGALHSVQEIEERRLLYANNAPVTREILL